MVIVREKKYKVIPLEPFKSWSVVRVGHRTRGDYVFGIFYDRGAIQIFTEALNQNGFVEVREETK